MHTDSQSSITGQMWDFLSSVTRSKCCSHRSNVFYYHRHQLAWGFYINDPIIYLSCWLLFKWVTDVLMTELCIMLRNSCNILIITVISLSTNPWCSLEDLVSDVVPLLLIEKTIKKPGPAPSLSKRTTALTSGDKLSCVSAPLPWSSRNTSADRSLDNSTGNS